MIDETISTLFLLEISPTYAYKNIVIGKNRNKNNKLENGKSIPSTNNTLNLSSTKSDEFN